VAIAVILTAWRSIDPDGRVPRTTISDRRRSWVMVGLAAFIALGRWLPSILDLMSGQPTLPEYLDNPTAHLLIGTLDLGLVVPAALAAAMGLRVGARWGRTAAYALIGWFALVPASVAAMSITMQVNNDPNADVTMTALFVAAAFVFSAGSLLLYRPLFRATKPS
jgi:hypothetical protein